MAIETETGFADVNGGRFYWEAAGSGEAVVFIHGFTLDSTMWDDQWEVFAERYRVIRYDSRGFGKSSVPAGSFSHQDDLRALLDKLGVGRFHAVGLSMGGAIALDYAVLRPGDLLSLTLVDSGLGGALSRAAGSHAELYRTRGLGAAKEAWMASDLFASLDLQPATKARVGRMVEDYSGWHWMNPIPQIVPEPPSAERLDSISVPTLVIVGALDAPRMLENAEKLATIPAARKEVVEGAGHMANMEQPAAVNALILDFLSGIPKP